jgi:hypothetical protein
MKYSKGTMVYGSNLGVEFIGTISGQTKDGKIRLDSAIIKTKDWFNLSDSMYEKEESILSQIDGDQFDLFYDVKKQPAISFNEFLEMVLEGNDVHAAAGSTD